MKGCKGANKWLVTATIVCGTLCIGVTMSMMSLAVPLMISDLQTDIDTIQWIITGPMLVNIALVPAVNWLTTRIGSRQVYLWAIGIWIATSLPCGLAGTAGGVIFYRLLQGIGGSLHIPTVVTVMYQAFPPQQRGLAMGLQQGAQWAAQAIGMTLGGYLLQQHGWRALFFYPIPIGLISIALALWVIPRTRDGTHHSLDWWGLATLTPALSLLLLAVSQNQRPACLQGELDETELDGGPASRCARVYGHITPAWVGPPRADLSRPAGYSTPAGAVSA